MNAVFCTQVIKTELSRRNAGLIFTDENVDRIYGEEIKEFLNGVPVHVMRAGEENKNERTLFALLRAMSEAGLRRDSTLIALGGGVVGDIGGLAASFYMRGIAYIQVPTTLLSQVDSSIGGKTAIDFGGSKNLIGAFYPPATTYFDPVFFESLPLREIKSGLGEIIKHGALHASIFEKLQKNRDRLFDLRFLAELVPENVAFKSSVVRQDPREENLRKCLNLGHTTAHALELGNLEFSHGECVLLGLIVESEIAERYFDCDIAFLKDLRELCKKVLGVQKLILSPEEAAKAALKDKKNGADGKIVLTVPTAPEKYELLKLSHAEYLKALKELLCCGLQ